MMSGLTIDVNVGKRDGGLGSTGGHSGPRQTVPGKPVSRVSTQAMAVRSIECGTIRTRSANEDTL